MTETRRIVNVAHQAVMELLTEHRDALDRLARALLEHETLDEHEAQASAGIAGRPTIGAGETTAQRRRSSPSAVAGS